MMRFVFLICAAHLVMSLMECGASTLARFRTPFGDITVELQRPRDRRGESFNQLTDRVFSLIEERA